MLLWWCVRNDVVEALERMMTATSEQPASHFVLIAARAMAADNVHRASYAMHAGTKQGAYTL
jgi:hypothetical protein